MGISEVAACHLMVNVSKALATLTVSIGVDACNAPHKLIYTWTTPVADLRAAPPSRTPMPQNFLNSIQFFWKIWQNRRLAPPTGNPGSAL